MNSPVVSALLCATIALGTAATPDALARRRSAPAPETSHGKLFKGRLTYAVQAGENLLLERKYPEAEAIFKKEVKVRPHNANAKAGLGLALAMQFKLDGASEQFDKALADDPQNALAHVGKALVAVNRLQSSDKSIIDRRDAILSEAEGEARQAVTIDPQLSYAHYALGAVLKEEQRLPDAYNEFKEAINCDPSYSEAYADMAAVDLARTIWPTPDRTPVRRFRSILPIRPRTGFWAKRSCSRVTSMAPSKN